MVSICIPFIFYSTHSFNSCLRVFNDNQEITELLLNKLIQLIGIILSPYFIRFKVANTLSNLSGKQSVVSTSTFSMNAARIHERMKKQVPEALSIQDYQLVVKILTVLSIHIPTLTSLISQWFIIDFLIIHSDLLLQGIDCAFYAGCLTQAFHYITSLLTILPSLPSTVSWLSCLLDILV